MGGQGTHLLNVLLTSFLYTPPSFYTFIEFMDFSQLDYILEHMASRYKVDAQEVLDKWLEKLLEGIPCIVGGLTALLGTLEGRGGNFPWKTLPTVLACRGCILEKYPEDILMPGERRSTLAKSKGIHDLTIHERFKLADALKNDALTCKSVATDALKSLTASRVPVIVGEAPIAKSLHTRGRRGFANGWIDRFGLTHLGNTSPSKSGATSSNRRRLHVFVEVPLAPPSWRLKAIQQCSPVTEPNHSDLVPEITTIKDGTINDDDAVSNATSKDEGDINELFSSQLQEQT
ncbi:uncharacterized protein F5891DRAFT_1185655 [Suillus fuscotomentosus]|uniref:Uncharacterized protein n=1 Tax=Suillus fuscotomentosus TaxID=1912939 RepID=A0AAD4EBC6_9AGAM|nr:uncharacterized protein F5891DRAFT_1185655 [Suillus fuscotomentosus]KAG1903007.1 hypothetical protein F5891DRAFT_1185655 [Suillus fuscotomentosus]